MNTKNNVKRKIKKILYSSDQKHLKIHKQCINIYDWPQLNISLLLYTKNNINVHCLTFLCQNVSKNKQLNKLSSKNLF